jgi:hypothetical protein
MIAVLGLIVLIAAVVVGVADVLTNRGSGHELTGGFSVFGHGMTGSTGMRFLYGIMGGGPVRAEPALDRCTPPLFSPRQRIAPAESSSRAARRPLPGRAATTGATNASPPARRTRTRRGTHPTAIALPPRTAVVGADCTCAGTDPPPGRPPPRADRWPASATDLPATEPQQTTHPGW